MKIEITHNTKDDNYLMQIWDGTDCADFLCSSLGECLEKLILFHNKVTLDT
jgi:hypothetical protein